MIIFTPNTVIKSTEVNSNFDEVKIVKSVDANGWTVQDFKVFKRYTKTVAVSSLYVGNGARTSISASNVPIGITNISSGYRVFGNWTGGYSGHAIAGLEPQTTTIDICIANQYLYPLTFNGYVNIMIEQI